MLHVAMVAEHRSVMLVDCVCRLLCGSLSICLSAVGAQALDMLFVQPWGMLTLPTLLLCILQDLSVCEESGRNLSVCERLAPCRGLLMLLAVWLHLTNPLQDLSVCEESSCNLSV
jgi:hypothetical protein